MERTKKGAYWDHLHQCAAGSGVRDGGWPPATGLQERVANHRKRRWSKARVVSVTEKALQRRQVGDRSPSPDAVAGTKTGWWSSTSEGCSIISITAS